jgi:hypothetical protein
MIVHVRRSFPRPETTYGWTLLVGPPSDIGNHVGPDRSHTHLPLRRHLTWQRLTNKPDAQVQTRNEHKTNQSIIEKHGR